MHSRAKVKQIIFGFTCVCAVRGVPSTKMQGLLHSVKALDRLPQLLSRISYRLVRRERVFICGAQASP